MDIKTINFYFDIKNNIPLEFETDLLDIYILGGSISSNEIKLEEFDFKCFITTNNGKEMILSLCSVENKYCGKFTPCSNDSDDYVTKMKRYKVALFLKKPNSISGIFTIYYYEM
jgi:hypothetical protein